jgi:hypothetical protein
MTLGTANAFFRHVFLTSIGIAMDEHTLCQENLEYRGTRGISQNNKTTGFSPAFREEKTGRIEIARLSNGHPAPAHIISWLPVDWALTRDEHGAIMELIPDIVSGFVRQGLFYTRK